jgi:hypothetical protein
LMCSLLDIMLLGLQRANEVAGLPQHAMGSEILAAYGDTIRPVDEQERFRKAIKRLFQLYTKSFFSEVFHRTHIDNVHQPLSQCLVSICSTSCNNHILVNVALLAL